jgi:hypothetical protein
MMAFDAGVRVWEEHFFWLVVHASGTICLYVLMKYVMMLLRMLGCDFCLTISSHEVFFCEILYDMISLFHICAT